MQPDSSTPGRRTARRRPLTRPVRFVLEHMPTCPHDTFEAAVVALGTVPGISLVAARAGICLIEGPGTLEAARGLLEPLKAWAVYQEQFHRMSSGSEAPPPGTQHGAR